MKIIVGNSFTMYPGTGREQLAGRNPLCKCLNRFELRVPKRKHQKKEWPVKLAEEIVPS